jgi:hypothetical protein
MRGQRYMHCKLDHWIGDSTGCVSVIFTVSVVKKETEKIHRREVSAASARRTLKCRHLDPVDSSLWSSALVESVFCNHFSCL